MSEENSPTPPAEAPVAASDAPQSEGATKTDAAPDTPAEVTAPANESALPVPPDPQAAVPKEAAEDAPQEQASDAASDATAGAQDTGRRIDPSKLQTGGPTRLRKGGRGAKSVQRDADAETPADKEASAADAPAPAAEAAAATPDGGEAKKKRRRRPNKNKKDDGRKGAKPEGPTAGPRELKTPPPEAKEKLVEFDYSGDFAAMLDEAGPIRSNDFRTGDEVQAKLISLGSESAFFDIGGNQEAYCSRADIQEDDGTLTLQVGETARMFVVDTRGGIQLSRRLSRHGVDVTMLESAKENGIPVEGKVVGHNKGGLELEIAGTRGFCPMGQADINFVEDPATFVGQTLSFLIKEVKENGRNVLVSRRALLQKERDEAKAKTMETLQVGSRITGTVTRVQPFGAFVDLGGVDGMIPVSELSWGRIEDPSSVVAPGDRLDVEVTRIEPDPKRKGELRIGLSRKTVLGDPWDDHAHKLKAGSTLEGKVTRTADFGAFVQLFDGIEGLVHISELSHERVHRVEDVVQVGAPVSVRVLDVDPDARRVSLSLKESRPEPAKGDNPSRGAKVSGTVERIERYGVFLALDTGVTALLPASETGTARGTDLSRAFALGTKVDVSVIDVDERGRVKVSKIARERAEERDILETYQKSDGGGGGSMGTLGDLLRAKLGK